MRPNATKAAWRRGDITYGAWLSIPSAFSAELVAQHGFDWVCIDMQHGVIDYQVAVTMLLAISTSNATPIVRVPWNEPGIIGKILDAGAMGIIIPMVNSPDEAAAAVAACRYAPLGRRSYGPTRAAWYAGADYFEHADAEIACIPMIETKRALDELDAILDVPGIDALYVGPADMSITLGQAPRMDNDGAFEEARLRIARASAARGITAGIHGNASLAAKHAAAGYRMITITSDVAAVAAGARADLAEARQAISPSRGGDAI
ncbi:MAG: aldolase/citrate lyase family protein [Chloroflexota bacterium]|nr:aldolase/citrate lyase family protein [Chloroflexota bacterium]